MGNSARPTRPVAPAIMAVRRGATAFVMRLLYPHRREPVVLRASSQVRVLRRSGLIVDGLSSTLSRPDWGSKAALFTASSSLHRSYRQGPSPLVSLRPCVHQANVHPSAVAPPYFEKP